jgi:enoyl reductase
MRAFVLTGYGTVADKVRLMQVPDPVADEGEVVIKIDAAGLNPIDDNTCRALHPAARHRF